MDEQADGKMDGQGWTRMHTKDADGWTDRQMDGEAYGQIDGWTNGRMNPKLLTIVVYPSSLNLSSTALRSQTCLSVLTDAVSFDSWHWNSTNDLRTFSSKQTNKTTWLHGAVVSHLVTKQEVLSAAGGEQLTENLLQSGQQLALQRLLHTASVCVAPPAGCAGDVHFVRLTGHEPKKLLCKHKYDQRHFFF